MSRTHRTADRDSVARPFTLWQEIAVAYLAPACTAGLGGVLSEQPELTTAAFTSIGATSAVVAAVVGAWLHRRGRPRRWTTAVPRPALTLGLGIAAAGIGGLTGWFASSWLPTHSPISDAGWLERLRIDLPLSAALAASIVTWRWRGTASSRATTPQQHR